MSKPAYTKLPTVRIPSDSCSITFTGTEYFPHKGEWVEVRPGAPWSFKQDMVGMYLLQQRLQRMADVSEEDLGRLGTMLGRIAAFISGRVVAWNWTDMDGEPLPSPSAEVIGTLEDDEVQWLGAVVMQGKAPDEVEAETKNG